ncbi:MAG: hypothetical protein DI570_01400 [Phenylobacterium zucineum]|nr:MAG: hypothetical protein DI570_01400 [Phenylobacterium zucineum]
MQSEELIRVEAPTLLGTLPFWTLPEPPGSDRPVLLMIPSSFMDVSALNRVPRLLADGCQVVLAPLPLTISPTVPDLSAWRIAAALDQMVGRDFRGRPVVAMGFGDGGLIAAMLRAPEVVRIMPLDPPLRSDKAWPLRAAAEARFSAAGEAAQRFFSDIYGAGQGGAARDHRHLFRSAQAPVEMLVGAEPLMPERAVAKTPSLVDEEDRAWLREAAGVRVRVVEGAGHDLSREAGRAVLDVARASAGDAAGFRRPLEQTIARLADATPWTARRVLYLGPQAQAFTAAFQARNPRAVVDAAASPGAYDAIVLAGQAPAFAVAIADALADDGCLLAATQLGAEGRLMAAALTEAGLTMGHADPAATPAGTVLIRARQAAREPLQLTTVVYARSLMDIRTELPVRGLRSAPDLKVSYQRPPFAQPTGRPAEVVVMTRPAEWTVDAWRATAARAIAARQVLVIEYDDHPELVHQITRGGGGLGADDWERFRLVHAIQTTTEPLVELFRRFNPEVALFPNAVFSLAPFRAGPRPRRVFFGGVSRGPFVAEVARALGPAIEAFPDTVFHVVGDRAFFDALPTQAKVYDDLLSYDGYLEAMAACSVSLSPLSDSPMVETKSDAKYLDAARAGVVTIASPTVYGRTIRSGQTGLIAATLDDWPVLLGRVLGDDAERERLARAAWDDVRDHRMFADQIAVREAWYRDLLARREHLDAAITKRAPGVLRHLPSGALRPAGGVRTT